MARKNVVAKKIKTAQSLAASFTTEPTVIQFLDNASYQINITTSDSTGAFSVEASLDYEPAGSVDPMSTTPNSGNWVTLNLTMSPEADAANDSILIDLNQLPYKAIRLKYTADTAGTGVCDVYVMARQLGG